MEELGFVEIHLGEEHAETPGVATTEIPHQDRTTPEVDGKLPIPTPLLALGAVGAVMMTAGIVVEFTHRRRNSSSRHS